MFGDLVINLVLPTIQRVSAHPLQVADLSEARQTADLVLRQAVQILFFIISEKSLIPAGSIACFPSKKYPLPRIGFGRVRLNWMKVEIVERWNEFYEEIMGNFGDHDRDVQILFFIILEK
jgi:hypothetical protein